jgi:hypothetical protein
MRLVHYRYKHFPFARMKPADTSPPNEARYLLDAQGIRAMETATANQAFRRTALPGGKVEYLRDTGIVIGWDEGRDATLSYVECSGGASAGRMEEEPHVIETFSFQVSPGRIVTPAGTIAAFEGWLERAFPGMKLPIVSFSHITESVDTFAEADLSDIRPEGSDPLQLPTSFEDIASLVAA